MTPPAETPALLFGNGPAKIVRYRAFWDRAFVPRPLDPRGLFLNIMVESSAAVESLRPLFSM